MEVKDELLINPERTIKIQPLIETFFSSITVLLFGVEEAELTAQIIRILKIARTSIGSYDVLVAAIAVQNFRIQVNYFNRVSPL
jgi:tRNA(fMet)-specific endonuclease VapC